MPPGVPAAAGGDGPGPKGGKGGLAGFIRRKPGVAGGVALAGLVGAYALYKSRSPGPGQGQGAASGGTTGYTDTGSSTPYTYGGGDNGDTANLTSGFEAQTAALQAQLAAMTVADAQSAASIAALGKTGAS